MSKKIPGLRTAIYKIGDIAQAKERYSKAFGTVTYFDQPFQVGFHIGGFGLGLRHQQPMKKPERWLEFGAGPHEAPRRWAVVSWWLR